MYLRVYAAVSVSKTFSSSPPANYIMVKWVNGSRFSCSMDDDYDGGGEAVVFFFYLC